MSARLVACWPAGRSSARGKVGGIREVLLRARHPRTRPCLRCRHR